MQSAAGIVFLHRSNRGVRQKLRRRRRKKRRLAQVRYDRAEQILETPEKQNGKKRAEEKNKEIGQSDYNLLNYSAVNM